MLPLASSTWDNSDIQTAVKVIESGNTSMGLQVKIFENEFASYHKVKHAVMVNSGSSANLIGLASLHWSGRLNGSEIIVPAVSWATTYYPVNQLGYKLVFVDIDPLTLNIDLKSIKNAISDETTAIVSVNLLGNSADYSQILEISKENDLLLIEDNCESLGASSNGTLTGTNGILGTFSFFFSHHLNTMEGGMIITNDSKLDDYMRSLRAHGWIRDLKDLSNVTSDAIEPAQKKFSFVLPGYNLRPTEIQGALGTNQLKKLDHFLHERRANASYFKHLFEQNSKLKFRLQHEVGQSSWFGFAIIAENQKLRDKAISKLESIGVETRPIVTGNFLRQPVVRHLNYRISGKLSNSDEIHDFGFFIGNHHYPIRMELQLVVDILSEVSN